MAQKNDQVFQLSLTEIAFTIVFILLLLLGYLVFKEQSERMAAEAALANVQSNESAANSLNEAKEALSKAVRSNTKANPDEVITQLIAANTIREERDKLKKKVDDLDAKLTALTELQQQLENAAKESRGDIAKDEIESALALQEQVRQMITAERATPTKPADTAPSSKQDETKKDNELANTKQQLPPPSKEQLNKLAVERVKQAITVSSELKSQIKKVLDKELRLGEEQQTIHDIVSNAKRYQDISKNGTSPETLRKENTDLRGQVAFLKNRLDARGGRDFPPCWADETGKVEFLFAIEIRPDTIVVTPAWPARREAAAKALPGISEMLAGPYSHQDFVRNVQGIFNWSKKQDPECRHYVQLKSSINDAVQSDRARLMVENYFYKTEARR